MSRLFRRSILLALLIAFVLSFVSVQSPTQAAAQITAKVLVYKLNVRASDTVKAAKVGELARGAVVTIIGRDKRSLWLKVQTAGLSGWVRTSFVHISGSKLSIIPIVS